MGNRREGRRLEHLQLAEEITQELADLGAYIYHHATTGSTYVKFEDERIGSLRIADHPGRKRYRYRWNLITDGLDRPEKLNDRGINRWYYPAQDVTDLLRHIRNYVRAIDRRVLGGREGE